TRHEAWQILPAELLAPVLLDVLRHPGLQPDDRHEARVGARDHLEVGAVDEHRQAVAAVLRVEGETEEPRTAELLVARGDVAREGWWWPGWGWRGMTPRRSSSRPSSCQCSTAPASMSAQISPVVRRIVL